MGQTPWWSKNHITYEDTRDLFQALPTKLRHNEVSCQIEYQCKGKDWQPYLGKDSIPLISADIIKLLRLDPTREYPAPSTIERRLHQQILNHVHGKESHNEYRDYLDNLPEWDKKKRLETFMRDCLMTKASTKEERNYYQALGIILWTAVYGRLLGDPDMIFQYMFIFSGRPMIGKSSFIRGILPTQKWVATSFSFSGPTRDVDAIVANNIIAEVEEFIGHKSADLEKMKARISQQNIKMRILHTSNSTMSVPARAIYIASSNNITPLIRDATGMRRFLPIESELVPAVDEQGNDTGWVHPDSGEESHNHIAKYLNENRDQLLAEAKEHYSPVINLPKQVGQYQAQLANSKSNDALADAILEAAANCDNGFSYNDLYLQFEGPKPGQYKVRDVLSGNDYEWFRRAGDSNKRWWRKSQSPLSMQMKAKIIQLGGSNE